jgi:hypothetical protein
MADSRNLLGGRALPRGHVCDRDDVAYTDVGRWYADHHRRVPITMAHGIDRMMRDRKLTFADAYRTLVEDGHVVHAGPRGAYWDLAPTRPLHVASS